MNFKILCINPGSTSTKLALFEDDECLWKENLDLLPEELAQFSCNNDQIPYRTKQVLDSLASHGVTLGDIDAFSGRGGGQASHVGGTYLVNELMVREAHDETYACHPALLACQICFELSERTGRPAYMTNSPATDEMRQVARITGSAGKYRVCYSHALNQKEIARRYAKSMGSAYEDMDLVVCHIGGGISVTAHQHGRMVDTNDILNGDGPMAPTRVGSLPAMDVVDLCFDAVEQGKDRNQVMRYVRGGGGLNELLGTYDAREVESKILAGDVFAKNVYDAMLYQIAKYIGAMYAALGCHCDAVLLTGGMAHSEYVVKGISSWIAGIAPVVVIPGEFEMEALAHGALMALTGEKPAMEYTGKPVWEPSMLRQVVEGERPVQQGGKFLDAGSGAIAGIGIDLANTRDFERPVDDPLFVHVFTERERMWACSKADRAEAFASIFAAKEAVFKALAHSSETSFDLRKIEVLHQKNGAPYVELGEAVSGELARMGAREINLSISNDEGFAVAIAVVG